MSKLSEYSKFDHLDDSSDDEKDVSAPTDGTNKAVMIQEQQLHEQEPVATTRKDPDTGRYVFECQGNTVYEWEQSLEEVNIYVKAPPGIKASQIVCSIQPNRLQLGIQGSDRFFIDEATFGLVDTSESSWYMDDSQTINIVLQKGRKAETWTSALQSVAEVNVVQKEEIQKSLLLERFQQENPGFDFRGAEFNGSVPDPRTFMGGVKYK